MGFKVASLASYSMTTVVSVGESRIHAYLAEKAVGGVLGFQSSPRSLYVHIYVYLSQGTCMRQIID